MPIGKVSKNQRIKVSNVLKESKNQRIKILRLSKNQRIKKFDTVKESKFDTINPRIKESKYQKTEESNDKVSEIVLPFDSWIFWCFDTIKCLIL